MHYKSYLLLSLLSLFLLSCQSSDEPISNTTPTISIQAKPKTAQEIKPTFKGITLQPDSTVSYQTMKQNVAKQRLQLQKTPISKDSLPKVFENLLLNQIIPYWYGTKWSFEGHSSRPNSGEIACGYFVSTTLRDMGLNINRYHLAQQSPINEAKTLALDLDVLQFDEPSKSANIQAINHQLQEGIYFIGFDQSHVGYLLKRGTQLYLIHSNYIGYEGVTIESIHDSEAFASYNRFYISAISTNERLLQAWLKGSKISIIKD